MFRVSDRSRSAATCAAPLTRGGKSRGQPRYWRARGGPAERRVARDPVGLAQGHRGDGVAVQPGGVAAADEQLAGGLLMLGEPVEALADVRLVAALDRVDVAGAQQRQESQPGGGGVR